MGNCQLDVSVSNKEMINQPQQFQQDDNIAKINQSAAPSQLSRNRQPVFNHNAKDRSKLTENNISKPAVEQNPEVQQKNEENILPPDINSGQEKEIEKNEFVLESGRQEQQSQDKFHSNVFDESKDFLTKNKADIINMTEYRNQIEEEVKKLEQSPPSSRLILPPFNYGDQSNYPHDFILEMRGAYRMQDGSTYVGEWHQDQIYGKGVKEGEEGKYEGYWVNGIRQGRGRFTFPDGSIYEGEWNNDKSNGIGTYYSITGTIYNGQWENDKRNGFGKEMFPSGASYEGEYSDDQRKGEGTFLWKDGSIFQGQFDQNKMNGKGKMNYIDGRNYEGEYKDGLMEGKGIFKWKDGRIYDGEYLNDRKHGYGKLFNPAGQIYEGYWKNGLMDGQGTITVGDRKRKGIWENGKRIKWIQ